MKRLILNSDEKQDSGQATLEFMIVTLVFMAIVVGMWSISQAIFDSILIEPTSENQSHSIEVSKDALRYVLLF